MRFFLRDFYIGLSIDVQVITKTENSSSNVIKLSALKIYSIIYHWRFSKKYSKPMYCLKKFDFFFLVKYQTFFLSNFFFLFYAVCNTKVSSTITKFEFWSHFYLTTKFKSWSQEKNKNAHVSGNVGDEKNLHVGGHKFIFLINLIDFFK